VRKGEQKIKAPTAQHLLISINNGAISGIKNKQDESHK
jgi:hypothetical protein